MLKPGAVRIVPGGAHLRLEAGGVLRLDAKTPARRGHRPAADELFASCARSCSREAVGVLMTGMGIDGVEGLSPCAAAGVSPWCRTRPSSVVFGMPQGGPRRGVRPSWPCRHASWRWRWPVWWSGGGR